MKVVVHEEHSSSLSQWWQLPRRPRAVIYLDAHLDLQCISDERISRLEACATIEQVESLAKPNHVCPDGDFSYSLANFLYPAARLGMIDRLVWVAPPHVRTNYSRANFERLCQMDGVQLDEVLSFKRAPGGWIEGRLLGLAMTICDYRDLGSMHLPGDCLIDVDIDYFVAVPGDRVWIHPLEVFKALSQFTPPLVTIARSVESGFTPVRYRFFADYLAALWEKRPNDIGQFERLFDLENQPQAGARAADLLRSTCAMRSRQLPVQLDDVLRLQRQAAESNLDPKTRGLIECECGLVFAMFRRLDQAIECYRGAGAHPELALEIAKLMVAEGREQSAVEYLKAALLDDKTRTTARLLLAQACIATGSCEDARQHLEQAVVAAPAWMDLVDMLAFVNERLGNTVHAQVLRDRAERQRQEYARFERDWH